MNFFGQPKRSRTWLSDFHFTSLQYISPIPTEKKKMIPISVYWQTCLEINKLGFPVGRGRERKLVFFLWKRNWKKGVFQLTKANAGDVGSIPGWGRSPGGGKGNPLQYSRLENSMDREAWWATVHGATKSQAWLSTRACTHKAHIGWSVLHVCGNLCVSRHADLQISAESIRPSSGYHFLKGTLMNWL